MRSAKPYRQAQAVGDFLGGLISETARKRGFARTEILTLWADLVGPEIAAGSQPAELKWPRARLGAGSQNGGTLHIHADGPTALLITHDTPRILERINQLFGYEAVTKIRVSQRALALRQPVRRRVPIITLEDEVRISKAVAGISDERLRTSLERFGRHVAAKNKKP